MELVWFDDEIEDRLGQFLVQRAEESGIHIATVAVTGRGATLDVIGSEDVGRVDIAVIDWNLGLGDLDGIELAQRVVQRWRRPVLFLTRYPKAGAIYGNIDPRIPYRECVKPDSYENSELERWYVDDFLPSVRVLGAVRKHSASVEVDCPEASSMFKLPIEEYHKLSLLERLQRKRDASDSLRNVVLEMFRSTVAPWVVVVGWPLAVVRVGDPGAEPPTREMLLEIEREWRQAPMVLLRPATVNSLTVVDSGGIGGEDRTHCLPQGQVRTLPNDVHDWFPVAEFEVKDHRLSIHFDTGAELSFLGYEFSREIGVSPELEHDHDWHPLLLRVGLASAVSVLIHAWRVKVRCQGWSGQIETACRLYLVREFEKSGMSQSCNVGMCPLAEENATEHSGSCRYRRGLLGRDLLLQSSWVASVDPVKRRVYFSSQDDFRDLIEQDVHGKRRRGRRWRV
ncbi:MAG: hypothetical protein M3083_12240 [Actinomycetota bacterium]|nr:hypothetical protein [Actinomycetota bacterium]MDQ6948390.1 hypothetical protein [Actinomycetota bacterium]